jgi:signal transduction histidine kinase
MTHSPLPIRSAILGFGISAAVCIVWAHVITASSRGDSGLARLEVAAGALAILAATASVIRARADGQAQSWWIGLGLAAFGIPAIALTPGSPLFLRLHFAAMCVAVCCLVVAVRSPVVDTQLSPIRSSALALLALVGLSAGYGALERFAVARPTSVVFAIAALLVSAHAVRRARGDDATTAAIVAVLAFGLGAAELVAAAVDPLHPLHVGGPALLRLMTTAIAAFAVIGELYSMNAIQRRAAYESHLLRTEAERDRREVEERFAETLHEVRSTVLALEGGVRHLDLVAATAEHSLSAALVNEIERLRALVSEDEINGRETRYNVKLALAPMLTVSVAGGWPVQHVIPDSLEASGRPADLAQVVHGLLTNAIRHAPGTPIDITGCRDGGYILVTVDDRGPGIERGLRDAIFERGGRAAARSGLEGEGLGLYIARSLMRRQAGDVWVEHRPGGGARFVVAVPAADPAATPIGGERRQPSLSLVRPGGSQHRRRERRSIGAP